MIGSRARSMSPFPPLWGKVGMGGAAARSSLLELGCHRVPDTFHISQHIVIPEPQHAKSLSAHVLIAPRIVSTRFGMLAAIDLDDDQRVQACEVSNVWTDADLSP